MDDMTQAISINSNIKSESEIFKLKISNLAGSGGQPTLFVSEIAYTFQNLDLFKWYMLAVAIDMESQKFNLVL